ncbi:MAG: acyl-CoA dehydrogenase, partial [Pseudomonadota bacterium]
DVRITQIYEGTNGVQALDLVGRKLVANNGENLKAFFEPLQAFLAEQANNEKAAEFLGPLGDSAQALQETTAWVYQNMARDPIEAGAASSDYLKLFALTATAFMWARMAVIAQEKLDGGETQGGFYQAKLDTARFFMTRVLPDRLGLEAKIKAGAAPMMALADEAF